MAKSQLPPDRLGFAEVRTPAELIIAKQEGHPNVRVFCKCGKSFVTSTGQAEKVVVNNMCSCINDASLELKYRNTGSWKFLNTTPIVEK